LSLYFIRKKKGRKIMLNLELEYLKDAYFTEKYQDNREVYETIAEDKKGNVYIVRWLSYENWDTRMDSGEIDEICNWDIPYSIQLIEEAEYND
jgi:hypothetical protein